MRIIGLDPGLQRTGWGVIDIDGSRLRFIAAGTVVTTAAEPMAARLSVIYEGLLVVMDQLNPNKAAVEETVVNRNPLSSLKLGHARGVVMLAAANAGLPVSEYASKRVKGAVTGHGNADKRQVSAMIGHLLPTASLDSADAADALAVAICHAHEQTTQMRLHAGQRS